MPDLCYRDCVRDIDPDASGVQADCYIEQDTPGEPIIEVPPCMTEAGEFVLPSDDADVCFGTITDPAAMSDECTESGWNLQFEIVRRPGVPVSPATLLLPECQLSGSPTEDCPGIGG
jgi:hypothetical protein